MIYAPYTRDDRVQGMAGMMRWIYLYFAPPVGGQVLGMLLS